MQPSRDFKVFAGNSNPALAQRICEYLQRPLGNAVVDTFSDGEIHVEIGENVRGQDVFIVQSTCPPTNHHLMELLIMCDALKRASAGSITAVMPYYGYARQDRKVAARTPITAKLVADMLEVAGVNRVVSMDMHAGQIQGFFNMPSDHLYGSPVFLEDIRKRFTESSELVIVSPDAGGVERARAYSKRLNTGLAIIDKRRPRPNASEVMNLIGDVNGKDAILVDDMVDTAGTLAQAALALKDKGARRVLAYAVHPILSGPAIQRITDSVLEEVVFTDTVPLAANAKACPKIRALQTDALFGEAIARIHRADSLSSLFV
ncbi:ribose-phosphate pyrophosphokinase [Corallococcus exiguus]|uniref:Ribose-phosphate pyrophosphokinase n=1 Tax=Corallococcus exiguus TaxID=83462 RepID=A0A7X4YCV8_9BACT|nr:MULTISPECIES: ribose-phosphate pyrophosphokinase [Corallococcus]RKI35902.1 ribose-phosphate pyrophosphokinase [Corallococcus sp. AB004]NBC41967.1 ribose-phosphate diphosphokinase [Corallococcus exiguus]NNC19345.1 ribose-phosphate pyrophosphokinase [Corallococcus exiguus]NPC74925.1 ribose-phosphate pyrophosphokinase [Corallococcus exiguus]NPD28904.1 ribose-phosphate pyrophosphokinase [Corallococcus exiguus]